MDDQFARSTCFGVPVEAYLATEFIAYADGLSATAMIGSRSLELDALLRDHGATHGVFITGWNPASRPHDAATNAAANEEMAALLARHRVVALHHVGRSPDDVWSEDGFFALDLDISLALEIAEAFGQFAVVVARNGEPAELVLTRIASAE